MKQIGKEITQNEAFLKREDNYKNLVRKISALHDKIKLGGGEKSIARQHGKGKLTARERIEKLIDPETDFNEINSFAAHGMYKEYGGAPSAGTVMGVGKINGELFFIVANDATVKAGAWFPMTA